MENGKEDREASLAIRLIEHVLQNDAFRPAMDEGDIEMPGK